MFFNRLKSDFILVRFITMSVFFSLRRQREKGKFFDDNDNEEDNDDDEVL